MTLSRKIIKTKQDIEVAGQLYETVNQFVYLESQINSKNSMQEEIRLRIQAGNRSLYANKKTTEKQGSKCCQ